MDERVETVNYKKCLIEIFYDEFAESPDNWGDESLFLVGFHRDFWVERKDFSQDLCIAIHERASAPANEVIQEHDCCDYEYEAQEILKEYHTFGLEAYIHSGVRLALSYEGNFPDRRWDVSQLGLVFIARKEWKSREKAEKAARGLIETWNNYLSGQVYGFKASDPERDVDLDSCWGYYGDYDKNGMIEEAKSSIDHYVKDYQATHYEI